MRSLLLAILLAGCGGGLLVVEETVEQPTLDGGACAIDAGGKAVAVPCDGGE